MFFPQLTHALPPVAHEPRHAPAGEGALLVDALGVARAVVGAARALVQVAAGGAAASQRVRLEACGGWGEDEIPTNTGTTRATPTTTPLVVISDGVKKFALL